MRKRWIAASAAAAVIGGLYAVNNSWSARPAGQITVLAHRGVAQQFSDEGLTMQSCTAARSVPVGHDFIENTLPSISQAFELGADIVEIDIHPTTDGEFVLFHDWTLDCRTNGTGPTREHSLAELRALDIAYGYTFDGGRTYPLRGKGVGLMPTLGEALAAFPTQRFLINIKSNDATEADRLHAYLAARPNSRPERLAAYGGERPIGRLETLSPQTRTFTKGRLKQCLKDYLLTGWTGGSPGACRDTMVFVPRDMGWILWGWPNRFLQRMQAAGTEVYLGGSANWKIQSIRGFDDPADLDRLPRGWRGGLNTDRIDLIGPAVEERGRPAD